MLPCRSVRRFVVLGCHSEQTDRERGGANQRRLFKNARMTHGSLLRMRSNVPLKRQRSRAWAPG